MLKVEQGILTMDSQSLETIIERVKEEKESMKNAVKIELELHGLKQEDIQSFRLDSKQMNDKNYISMYFKIAEVIFN